jgi:beta-glucuronidase
MKTLSLNGYWDWSLPHGPRSRMNVPSSYACVGEAVYERDFHVKCADHECAFLCFEGIQYTGSVELDGTRLGEMLPYVPYRFDITDRLREAGNKLRVAVKDITAEYGPTGGWEDYGGISRDVFIEVRDRLFVDDVHWRTDLGGRTDRAACALDVVLANRTGAAQDAEITVGLRRRGTLVCSEATRAQVDGEAQRTSLSFELDAPELWSPETPALYDLDVAVAAGRMRDAIHRSVGIREFRVDGSRFLLNGKETFLKGVARHEMWGDQGFSLSDAQVEEDLTLVKRMGGNFVRLVHYPHSRSTIAAADRIGVMVSEEPGLWWSDMASDAVTSRALEVMRRTVLRDRNSPSVIAWLFFNECVLKNAGAYLVKGRELCRSLDPTRLVSGANCMDSAEAKRVFDECGFDFYTQHPYAYQPDALEQAMRVLRGKPLVFTEWGGWFIHENPNLLEWFKKVIARAAHARDPDPCLAGMCWWQWQDIWQLNRGLPGCREGLLSDGLVDRHRRRKPMYDVMAEIFDLVDRPLDRGWTLTEVGVPTRTIPQEAVFHPLDLSAVVSSGIQRAAWDDALGNIRRSERTKMRQDTRNTGPRLPRDVESVAGMPVALKEGRPVVLAGDCMRVEIPVGRPAAALHFLGQVTYFDGFPVRGAAGEKLARYLLMYDNGEQVEVPLRNGMEMASASMIAGNSRMNPIAVAAERVLVITIDPDFEIYQVNHLVVPVDGRRRLERIAFESLSPDYCPLLYGITVESP